MNLSIVVPVFNEEESIGFFYKEFLQSLSKEKGKYEIIFVDDGSTDSSLSILKTFTKQNNFVRVFSFRKNRGKSEALSYGFSKADAECVVTMDADLQDKPTEMFRLIAKLKEGYDCVSGWRKDRKDTGFKIILSKLFNILVSFIFSLKLHDYNCGLKAYTGNAAKSLRLYGGLHRFIPLLLHQDGFKVCEIAVSHSQRKYGKSKFGASKVWRDLPDIFTMIFLIKYSKRPLHFFGAVGFILLFLGFSILLYLTFNKLVGGVGIGDRPLFFLGILLVLTGFQVFFTGFLADLFINVSQSKTDDKQEEKTLLKYSSDN